VTRIETIAEDYLNEKKVGFVSDVSQDELEKYRLYSGDILISHINSGQYPELCVKAESGILTLAYSCQSKYQEDTNGSHTERYRKRDRKSRVL
jgi:hypothetical protein